MTDEIEKLSRRRQQLWQEGADPVEIKKISRQLEDLYEAKRIADAQTTSGGRTRKEIVKQARIESELDRLSSR